MENYVQPTPNILYWALDIDHSQENIAKLAGRMSKMQKRLQNPGSDLLLDIAQGSALEISSTQSQSRAQQIQCSVYEINQSVAFSYWTERWRSPFQRKGFNSNHLYFLSLSAYFHHKQHFQKNDYTVCKRLTWFHEKSRKMVWRYTQHHEECLSRSLKAKSIRLIT